MDSINLLSNLMSDKHEENVKTKIAGFCKLLTDSRQDHEVKEKSFLFLCSTKNN